MYVGIFCEKIWPSISTLSTGWLSLQVIMVQGAPALVPLSDLNRSGL